MLACVHVCVHAYTYVESDDRLSLKYSINVPIQYTCMYIRIVLCCCQDHWLTEDSSDEGGGGGGGGDEVEQESEGAGAGRERPGGAEEGGECVTPTAHGV